MAYSCTTHKTTKVNIEVGVNDYATIRAKKIVPTQSGSKKVSGPGTKSEQKNNKLPSWAKLNT